MPSTFGGAGRDEGSEVEAACCVALITAGLDPRASWKDTEQPEMQVESGHEMSCHLKTFAACIRSKENRGLTCKVAEVTSAGAPCT